jgi:type III secretion protein U
MGGAVSSEKTEEPTHKRLRDSRKKGDVAHSKDFTQTILIIALFGYMLGNAENIIESLGAVIVIPASLVGLPFEVALSTAVALALKEAVSVLLPFLLIVLIGGMFGEFLQVGFLLAFEKLKPSGKKLNIIANVKNTFSKKNFVEFAKSILKISFLSALIIVVVRDALPALMSVPSTGLEGLGAAVGSMMGILLVNVAIVYVIIAAADFVWQRMQYRKGLMMSKDEVKREYKEMEGDPHIKHKRKHLHQEMAMESGATSSRRASVLVTNPTHIAVALFYQFGDTPLPILLAKGEGAVAQRMRRAAREAGTPVIENVPLARALWHSGEIDKYIPDELIEPVAEVLRIVRRFAVEGEL